MNKFKKGFLGVLMWTLLLSTAFAAVIQWNNSKLEISQLRMLFTNDGTPGWTKIMDINDGWAIKVYGWPFTDSGNYRYITTQDIAGIGWGMVFHWQWDASTLTLPPNTDLWDFYVVTNSWIIAWTTYHANDQIVANSGYVGGTVPANWTQIIWISAESDPIFQANSWVYYTNNPLWYITWVNLTPYVLLSQTWNWNIAFGRGNHSIMWYLTGSALNWYLTWSALIPYLTIANSWTYYTNNPLWYITGSALSWYITWWILANYLTLNQVTPQIITWGIPTLYPDRNITDSNQLVDKLYVDTMWGGWGLTRFFTKQASNIIGMYSAQNLLPTGWLQTISATVTDWAPTLVATRITQTLTSPVTTLAGIRTFYVNASTTQSSKTIQMYFQTYKSDLSGGSLVPLILSDNSFPLTSVAAPYIMSNYGNYWIQPITERRVIRLYAFKADNAGADPVISVNVEDATYTRLDIPSPVGVTDLTNYATIAMLSWYLYPSYGSQRWHVDAGTALTLTATNTYYRMANLSGWLFALTAMSGTNQVKILTWGNGTYMINAHSSSRTTNDDINIVQAVFKNWVELAECEGMKTLATASNKWWIAFTCLATWAVNDVFDTRFNAPAAAGQVITIYSAGLVLNRIWN